MSKDSRELVTSTDMSKVGPDHFTFYACEVKELLSQNEDSSSLTTRYTEDIQSKVEANSLFNNSVGVGFSNYKKERLNSSLRQSLAVLTPQVDEVGGSVVAMCKLQSEFRSRKLCSGYKGTEPEDEMRQKNPDKRIKTSSFSSTTIAKPASPVGSGTCREVDSDLQFLLENDRSLVEEAIKKYSDQLSNTLGHMEKQLEVILDTVVSTCRPMTQTEKQQLRKLIQKLPPKNLNRVFEIVQRGKPVKAQEPDEVFVDLEQEDNLTLWRLYYYTEAVEKARELAS